MSSLLVGDIEMFYQIQGQGEPLLFIHGLGSSSVDWQFQRDEMAKHFETISVDVRGHGQSGKSGDRYSIELFASDIIAFLNKLNYQKVHLVGLSMGGMIAFQMAIDAPELIASMTIVNSGPDFIAKNFKTRWKFALRYYTLKLLGLKAIAGKIADGLFPYQSQADLHRTFIKQLCDNHKPSYLKSLKALSCWSVANDISTINSPTLVLSADKDYTSVAWKKNYVDLMKNAQLVVIEDSHHALPVEKPEEFNQALLTFLTSLKN